MKKNILVAVPCADEVKARFAAAFGEEVCFTYTAEKSPELPELLKSADAVIGEPTIEMLLEAPSVRWVQMTWAGTDIYTRRAGFPEGVALTNASGAYGKIISEYVMAMALAHYRLLPAYFVNQQKALWQDAGSERTLDGKTVLIIGTGDIGSNVAKRMAAFGAVPVGVNRRGRCPEGFAAAYTAERLDDLLPVADIVVGCAPNTDGTVGLLNKERLLLMKKDAVLINVGRGGLIVTEDLVEVLRAGHLSGVSLDVYETEPLDAAHPLWSMERVLLTPHISGKGFGHDPSTSEAIWDICMHNIRRWLDGEPLMSKVDIKAGY